MAQTTSTTRSFIISLSHGGLALLDGLLGLYQRTLSPDHGWLRSLAPYGVCRFEPTCSQYAREALRQHGWVGVMLSLRRVSRCHPWSRGGLDAVPSRAAGSSSAETIV